MMGGIKATLEYEINASKRMLYPYISTASGLEQWFADEVSIDDDKNFHFVWDGEEHIAKMVAHRINNFVRFEFINDVLDGENAFTEIRIEHNELTQSVFLRITDYSDMEDQDEVRELWDNIILDLKEIVGG